MGLKVGKDFMIRTGAYLGRDFTIGDVGALYGVLYEDEQWYLVEQAKELIRDGYLVLAKKSKESERYNKYRLTKKGKEFYKIHLDKIW